MPREKKENTLLNLSYSKIQDQKQNTSSEKKYLNINYTEENNNNDIDMKNIKKNLSFKNPSFISKYKNKDKPIKTSKTPKNLVIDNLDSISLNICKLIYYYILIYYKLKTN